MLDFENFNFNGYKGIEKSELTLTLTESNENIIKFLR